jgi:hypothetical protein
MHDRERRRLDPEFPVRVEARRTFLREEIGLTLDPAVLPLSNTPLWHTPFALDRDRALTVA